MERQGMHPVAEELIERIGWLINLRWLAVAGVVCTIEVARRAFKVHLATEPLYTVTAALALYNLILVLIARRLRRPRAPKGVGRWTAVARLLVPRPLWGMELEGEALRAAAFANAQISIDLVFLSALLHFSGGIENPFVYFFIFHVIISSILLSRRITYVQASLGFVLITAVALGECFGILKHYPLNTVWMAGEYRNPMWVGAQLFVLGATIAILVYLCSTIVARLRQRERKIVLLSQELFRKGEALEVACEKMAESERAKSRYLRKVAHELRGPLGTIQTALSVVLDGLTGDIPDRTRDLVGRAERRAKELGTVTHDLLVLSRAEGGRQTAEMLPVQPDRLVTEVATEVGELAKDAGVSLALELALDLGPIEADPTGLRQLVSNLLTNAIRYTPRGGRIVVRLTRIENSLRIEVEDTGIGIPVEDLPRVFDEFFRSKKARESTSDGTGLGLSIVKAVTKQHGGFVSVESEVGRGTRVTVDLPQERVSPAGTDNA